MRALGLFVLCTLSGIGAVACGGASDHPQVPQHADIPIGVQPSPPQATSTRESPPAPLASKDSPFPAISRTKLANGLEIATVTSHSLPIVQVRLVVHAGSGYVPALPGVPDLTGQMLKDGGTRTMTSADLLNRVESLGADLDIGTDEDATTISLGVTKDKLPEALGLLAEVVGGPRFDESEFKKLKKRSMDEAEDRARSSGGWAAAHAQMRELFAASSPYASYGATPAELTKVTMASVKDFYKKFFVPKNATLVLAGDLDDGAAKLIESKFSTWSGGEAPKVDFPAAIPPKGTRVLLVNRPKSAQSDINVCSLAPERSSPSWPQIRVANQVLGGGVAGRLFLDVREQRSLAYSTGSRIMEVAHGQQPFTAYAGTQTAKTGLAVQGLIDNLEKIKSGVTDSEIASAERYLSDIFAVRMETIGAIASMVATQVELGLPDGYWDQYRAAVKQVTTAQASDWANKLASSPGWLIVVSGDADVIGTPLSHFGEVTVLDPEAEFKTVKTIPANPQAPIEIAK
ncbi:MAG: pitrilysin family protein [Polyangiaceae bacterium]